MVLSQPDDKVLFDPTNFECSASLSPDEFTLLYGVTWQYDMIPGE